MIKIDIVLSDDGMMDYSIMVLVKANGKSRLFNRLLIEDYKGGEIHAF